MPGGKSGAGAQLNEEKMKTVAVYRRDGSQSGTVDLPDEVFGVEPSMTALHQVVTAYLANQRQGNASTKTRSEVNITKSKPFRQKGTGRARAGGANSPVWVGGGIVFGPKPRDYTQKVNQKVRKAAIKSAYSLKANEDNIRVVEDFTLDQVKTKEISGMLKALGISGTKTIFVMGAKNDTILKSSRNIPRFCVESAENVNTYQVMNSDMLLITKSAVDRVKEVLV